MNPDTWFKGKPGVSPVSEADLAVDKFSRRNGCCAARPDYGWLSEETADDQERASDQRHASFIVDPIDGTRAHFLPEATSGPLSLAVVEFGPPCRRLRYICPRASKKCLWPVTVAVAPYLNGDRS